MRLITNLSSAQLEVNGNTLRLDCQALLLEGTAIGKATPIQRLRGFGPDSAWPVFSLWLSCNHLEYKMENAESDQLILNSDVQPEGRPIFSGATMKFVDGTELSLHAQDDEQPFDISDHEDYEVVWKELFYRSVSYYNGPNFPLLQFVPKYLV
ncbi:MAG: hypothetical protein JWN28_740 [Candidatus Saccharibacteria bacterium]|nr:hypothetical protein [Candidatus Saccharibacteria bacterium]